MNSDRNLGEGIWIRNRINMLSGFLCFIILGELLQFVDYTVGTIALIIGSVLGVGAVLAFLTHWLK